MRILQLEGAFHFAYISSVITPTKLKPQQWIAAIFFAAIVCGGCDNETPDPSPAEKLTATPWLLNVIEPEAAARNIGLVGTQWTFLPDSTLTITGQSTSSGMMCSWKITSTDSLEVALPFQMPDGTPLPDIILFFRIIKVDTGSLEIMESFNDDEFLYKFSK